MRRQGETAQAGYARLRLRSRSMGITDTLRQVKHQSLLLRKRLGKEGRTRARHRRNGVGVADENIFIHPSAEIAPGVTIGPDTRTNRNVYIEDGVTIGSGVSIGRGAYLCTRSHKIAGPSRRAGAASHAPIAVGEGVWIGAHSVVLPGVSIASGCVIAAGAVVTKDTAPDGLYAGVPAVRIRDLD